MGAITLRREEVAEIYKLVALSDEELAELSEEERKEAIDFGTRTAKAVLAKAFELMRKRDWYVPMHHYSGDQIINVGLEPTKRAAIEWAAKNIGGGQVAVARIHPAHEHEQWLAAQELELAKATDPRCSECGHPEWAHKLVTYMGKPVERPKGTKVWCSSACKCKEFKA
jgi:hypothetical protein